MNYTYQYGWNLDNQFKEMNLHSENESLVVYGISTPLVAEVQQFNSLNSIHCSGNSEADVILLAADYAEGLRFPSGYMSNSSRSRYTQQMASKQYSQ